jgi:hypothetical protein
MLDHIVRRVESSRHAAFSALCLLMLTAASTVSASEVSYGAGGLPNLAAYPVGSASFDTMAPDLGTPVSLDTNGANQVTSAVWWLPAQGYAAPAATSTAQRATQAASSGFFSRMRSQAVGTVAGMVPGVGGVIAGQAANAVASSAVPSTAMGGAIPGWWCRAVYPAPGYRLSSVSCSPHAYTPMS